MEPLFVLLIMGAFALAKWFLKNGEQTSESDDKQQTARPDARHAMSDSEEERMRKFMEALGMPKGSAPPRPITPRAEPQARPLSPVRPPVVLFPNVIPRGISPKPMHGPSPTGSTKKKRPSPPPVPHVPQAKPTRTEAPRITETVRDIPPAVADFPVTETQPTNSVRETRRDVRALLGSGAGLRDAILLREILGPPRGLQSGGF